MEMNNKYYVRAKKYSNASSETLAEGVDKGVAAMYRIPNFVMPLLTGARGLRCCSYQTLSGETCSIPDGRTRCRGT